MKFADGTDIRPGDIIRIDTVHQGRVIASMDTNECLPGQESWSYLETGIMVDTDFAGLVHYTSETEDDFMLIRSGAAAVTLSPAPSVPTSTTTTSSRSDSRVGLVWALDSIAGSSAVVKPAKELWPIMLFLPGLGRC